MEDTTAKQDASQDDASSIPSASISGGFQEVVRHDLAEILSELKRRTEYERGDPSGKTLLKVSDLRVLVLALKAGGHMAHHSSSGPIAIHVLHGKVGIDLGDRRMELEANQLLTLHAEIDHAIEAVEDSEMLLTIGHTRYEVEPSGV